MIPEERLKAAARRTEEHILSCLPDPNESEAAFSPRFERKMKRLFFKINHPLIFWIPRVVATLLLTLLSLFVVCLFSIQPCERQFSDSGEDPCSE